MRRAWILCFVAGLFLQPAKAQVLYGTLVGTVEDASGAVIQGVTVTLTAAATGQSHQTTTTEAGGYRFPDLLPGAYKLSVTARGFSTFVQNDIPITINTVSRVNMQLR